MLSKNLVEVQGELWKGWYGHCHISTDDSILSDSHDPVNQYLGKYGHMEFAYPLVEIG